MCFFILVNFFFFYWHTIFFVSTKNLAFSTSALTSFDIELTQSLYNIWMNTRIPFLPPRGSSAQDVTKSKLHFSNTRNAFFPRMKNRPPLEIPSQHRKSENPLCTMDGKEHFSYFASQSSKASPAKLFLLAPGIFLLIVVRRRGWCCHSTRKLSYGVCWKILFTRTRRSCSSRVQTFGVSFFTFYSAAAACDSPPSKWHRLRCLLFIRLFAVRSQVHTQNMWRGSLCVRQLRAFAHWARGKLKIILRW